MDTALFNVEGTSGDGKLVLDDEGKQLLTPYCSQLTGHIPAMDRPWITELVGHATEGSKSNRVRV